MTSTDKALRSTGITGSASLQIGFAGSPDTNGDGEISAGGGVALLAWFKEWLLLGPEFGIYSLEADERVWYLTATAKFTSRRDRPAVWGVLASGLYSWRYEPGRYLGNSLESGSEDLTYLGYAIGAGVGRPLGRRLWVTAEVRYHANLQSVTAPRDFNLITGTFGLEFGW
jgi:hypothetical protein